MARKNAKAVIVAMMFAYHDCLHGEANDDTHVHAHQLEYNA